MNVKELIEQLKKVPENSIVRIPTNMDGFSEDICVRPYVIGIDGYVELDSSIIDIDEG